MILHSELWQWRIRPPFSAFSERALNIRTQMKKKNLHFHDCQRNQERKSHISFSQHDVVFILRCGPVRISLQWFATWKTHSHKHTHTIPCIHDELYVSHINTLEVICILYTFYSLGFHFISKSERWKKAPRVNRNETWEMRKHPRQIRMKLMLRLRTSSIKATQRVATI